MTDYFHLNANRDTLMNLSSLGLAHLGDSVYEVMVRSWLCLHGKARAADLHKATVKYVAAPAQARMVQAILPLLTEEEQDVFRRGRNTAPLRPQGGQPGGVSDRHCPGGPVRLAVSSGPHGAAE